MQLISMSVDPKNHYEDKWFNSYRNEYILKSYYYSEERFPYQLIQRKLPSEGLIVNPITNSADKSSKNYRKSFLTKLCRSSLEKWTTSANWSHWFKHHIKWITAQTRSPKFNVTSKQKLTWTPVSLWSLQKRNSFEMQAQESREKII